MAEMKRSFNVSAVELMDLLKEELMSSCIYRGEEAGRANLTGEEEVHLVELYKILKPLAEQVTNYYELRYELTNMNKIVEGAR